jgi:hypothetical protein
MMSAAREIAVRRASLSVAVIVPEAILADVSWARVEVSWANTSS